MRGKFTGKVSTSPASARQEMTRTEDYANGDAQCLQSGLQTESGGAAASNNASRNGDDWGVSLSSSADPWGPSSSGGDCFDSTNQVNGDEGRDEECRHCRGAHKSDECPESRGGGSGSDRRQDTRVCRTCGQEGHISKYCRQNGGDRQWGGDRQYGNDRSYGSAPAMERCAICEGKGHRAEACPTPRDFLQRESNNGRQSPPRSGRPQQAQVSCHRCNATDHYAHNCPTRVGYEADKDDVSGPYDHIVTISEGEAINRNRTGENFGRFDDVQVKVTNSDGSETHEYENRKLKTFRDANLVESVMAKIAELEFDEPAPVQRYAIPILADGKDLIACAQTGSGKTAAFVLPIVNALIRSNLTVERGRTQRPYALILAPTRELVVQITKDALHFSFGSQIKVKECYGGTKLPKQIINIQEGCHVLVCTAGRFEDFLRREIISLSEMRYLVLDEADRMLDRGFSQTVINIKDHHSRNKSIESQTIMFSATFPREVQDLARKLLRKGFLKLDVGVVGTVCQDVSQYVEEIKGLGRKKDRLLELIEKEMRENSAAKVLVFVETKRTADTIASYLSELNIKATSMHGDRLQEQREKALRDFQRNDCPVLVATSVAARGLDITNVGHVVNFDLPKDIDEYVHRVGRTGRVGNKGRATSFFDSDKDYLMRDPLRQSFLDGGQEAPSFL